MFKNNFKLKIMKRYPFVEEETLFWLQYFKNQFS